jgi:16S rRNA (cytosine967-C5)-methyltransferase
MTSKQQINCREAAYKAYLASMREEQFISDSLNDWMTSSNPSEVDYHLAQEIAYGTCQRAITLEYYANKLVDKKLKLKKKEKALLLTALYQYYFLERIPLYAITNETMQIAKKSCHSTFLKFLNAILRKLPSVTQQLPKTSSVSSLSIRYSYPEIFVDKLINQYGLETSIEIMEAGNKSSLTLARERHQTDFKKFMNDEVNMVMIENKEQLLEASLTPNLYIQNITPALLFSRASKTMSPPEAILDLCASPGGKLLMGHDFFPEAELFANDISENKLETLKENIEKYNLETHIVCGKGEEYSSDKLFDLIILDVPCSNSGVLNKRAEARWRQSKDHHKQLVEIQNSLLKKALTLLSPKGMILYMTCTILKEENEDVIDTFSKTHSTNILYSETILPTKDGYDGGYVAVLENTK